MAAYDWVVLALLGCSLLLGAWRGLVYEVLSMLNWLAAFLGAQWFAPQAGAWLPMGTASQGLRYAAGFLVVFILIAFLGGLLTALTKKLIEAVGLRPVDRTLGAAFGLVRGGVLVVVVAVLVHLTPLRAESWWRESKAAGVSTAVLRGLKPVLPLSFGQYLPN